MPKRTRLQLIHPFLWLYAMANRCKASQEEIHAARLSGHQEEPRCDPGCWEQRGCSQPGTSFAAQSQPQGTAPGQACKPAATSWGGRAPPVPQQSPSHHSCHKNFLSPFTGPLPLAQLGTGRCLLPCAGDRFYHPTSPDCHLQPPLGIQADYSTSHRQWGEP